jgi:hypothetical protein
MTDAVDALLSIGTDYQWKKVVWNWTLFERMLGYPGGGKVCFLIFLNLKTHHLIIFGIGEGAST